MVVKNIMLIFKYLALNLKKEAQYKTSFILQIVMMILNDLFFILQWLIIFSITPSIGGFGFRECMLLWSLSAGSYGFAHLFFEGAFHIDEIIYQGGLDVYLTQPKNLLVNLCCSKTSVSAIGDIIYSIVALAIGGATWWWYLAILPICMIGGLIYVGIILCFQSLNFYVKRGGSIANMIHSSITLFSNYPPIIFNMVAKIFLYSIIPCGFMVFVPAQYLFLGFNIWWLLAMLGFMVFSLSLAFILFRIGLKCYTSGNLMNGRI